MSSALRLTDGGLETTLVFKEGVDLPDFAAFPLLTTDDGRETLRRYYRAYADVARRLGVGIVLDTPTWRASADWGARLGFDASALAKVNITAVELLGEIRAEYAPDTDVAVSGNLGPRGDGYDVGTRMTIDEAERYHRPQLAAFAAGGADLATVLTMTYADEAIGVARAAARESIPAVVSFTVETDGTLPSGEPLGDAIEAVDAATDGYPLHFGINCAHPDHFASVLSAGDGWPARIGLLRANASRMSHAELDSATTLDDGDPDDLAAGHVALSRHLPGLAVVGGCCGTDDRHVEAIGRHLLTADDA